MMFAIVVSPGSNCDHDAHHAVSNVLGYSARLVWHKEKDLGNCDAVLLPGGFSHGDYLRVGAIARFSPVMDAVVRFARRGGPVLGICNGFQVLLESGLLPGAMLRNQGLKFKCEQVHLSVESVDTPFTRSCARGQVLRMPIAHGDGNYYAPPETLRKLEDDGQVILRYSDSSGEINDRANPNGSSHSIAGICNEARNVVGLMPHPERACEEVLGSQDGRFLFESIVANGLTDIVKNK